VSEKLKNKTVLGLKWNFVNQFGVQFFNLLFSILLARVLSPTEYGLIAMVTVFTGFSAVLLDFGFGNALIYKDNPSKTDWSTVFWFNIFLGIFLFLLLYLASPVIAAYYDISILETITALLACNFLLANFSIVYRAMLARELNFKGISIADISSIVLSGVVGIVMALLDYGVWSLVFQRLSASFFRLFAFLLITKWLPSIVFSIASFKEVFSYSIYLLLEKMLNYWSRNADNMLIGKYIGEKDLGVYNRAYSFLMFPITAIVRVVTGVLFPTMSKMKDDVEGVQDVFIRVSRMVVFLIIPLMSIFFLCSKEITLIVFGEKWIEMVPLLELFAFLGVYQSIIGLNGPIYLSKGETRLNFKVGLFTETINILAIIIGINWGLKGIIAAFYIALMINFFPHNYFILSRVKLSVIQYYKRLMVFFLMAVIPLTTVLILLPEITSNLFLSLLVKVAAFNILYLFQAYLLKLTELTFIKNKIMETLNRGQ